MKISQFQDNHRFPGFGMLELVQQRHEKTIKKVLEIFRYAQNGENFRACTDFCITYLQEYQNLRESGI